MFRLMGVAILGLAACAGDDTTKATGDTGAGSDRAAVILALTGDAVAGETLFSNNCALCHGADASGGSGPNIQGNDASGSINAMLTPPGSMPGFDSLADQEIADIAAFISGT